MKVNDVIQCSFPAWYDSFRNITIKSIILPLPKDVLTYLKDNGTIVLPSDSSGDCSPQINSGSEDEWDESSEMEVAVAPNLGNFGDKIKSSISDLGGTVFPKLNWSSPKDASWISYNRTLQCWNPKDIYLLLKSSTFVAHDLNNPFKDCEDVGICEDINYSLILRKWEEMNPSNEFRCFVKNKRLIDVFDIDRSKEENIVLIDFGPFGLTTDPILFSWEELSRDEVLSEADVCSENSSDSNLASSDYSNSVDFRIVLDELGVQPSPYLSYGLPSDAFNIAQGMDADSLIKFLKMKLEGRSSPDTVD